MISAVVKRTIRNQISTQILPTLRLWIVPIAMISKIDLTTNDPRNEKRIYFSILKSEFRLAERNSTQ